MSGTRHARTAVTRALAAAFVALLCLFAAGPAAASAAWEADAGRHCASGAPGEPEAPAERESDPAGEPEVRAAVRPVVRGLPGARELPRPVFHVKHPHGPAAGAAAWAVEGPVPAGEPVRSVVLRC
ncbi:hypothetical protein AB0953_01875 [Streptomyces sp. NPDC046866]|uniref:hypothetical protein n=1 Tax=Streptomyces sp. NPDC046866 TaxID=3154921 RepID=UPI0034514C04